MPHHHHDHRYETALTFALAIIREFDRPGLTRPAKLARVTYAVLDAIYQAEDSPGCGPDGRSLPASSPSPMLTHP